MFLQVNGLSWLQSAKWTRQGFVSLHQKSLNVSFKEGTLATKRRVWWIQLVRLFVHTDLWFVELNLFTSAVSFCLVMHQHHGSEMKLVAVRTCQRCATSDHQASLNQQFWHTNILITLLFVPPYFFRCDSSFVEDQHDLQDQQPRLDSLFERSIIFMKQSVLLCQQWRHTTALLFELKLHEPTWRLSVRHQTQARGSIRGRDVLMYTVTPSRILPRAAPECSIVVLLTLNPLRFPAETSSCRLHITLTTSCFVFSTSRRCITALKTPAHVTDCSVHHNL